MDIHAGHFRPLTSFVRLLANPSAITCSIFVDFAYLFFRIVWLLFSFSIICSVFFAFVLSYLLSFHRLLLSPIDRR